MNNSDPPPVVSPIPQNPREELVVFTAEEDGAVNWGRYFDNEGQPLCDLDLRVPASFQIDVASPQVCAECPSSLTPSLDRVSVRRRCVKCDRDTYQCSDDPTQGPEVKKGEQVTVPSLIFRSNMFLTGGASFSQRGVDWLARSLFTRPIGMLPVESRFSAGLQELAVEATAVLNACPLLSGIDRSTGEGFAEAMRLLMANPIDPGMAALLLETKAQHLLECLNGTTNVSPTSLAATAWSVASAASLLRFKTAFEEAAYRGHSLEKLRRIVSVWENNKQNDSEQFWQDLLLANPVALGQLFSAPVVIHGERYLVGGVRAGGKHGKITDYLFRNQLTDAALIVEIKTPCTRLLYDGEYRQDVFAPTRDLSGSVQQALEQRSQFMKQMNALQAEQEANEPRVEVVEPHCVVVIGSTSELDTRVRRRSFEAYRSELRNIRVVTFDELFAKLNGLVGLLGGARKATPA